jgi:hypothetical protein
MSKSLEDPQHLEDEVFLDRMVHDCCVCSVDDSSLGDWTPTYAKQSTSKMAPFNPPDFEMGFITTLRKF